MGMPLGSDSGGMKAPSQSSSKLNTSVGSGSRPGNSKFMIDTSHPKDPYKLDGRGDVKGFLGSGSEKARG